MIEYVAHTSIFGRAVKSGVLSVETINIRDFSTKNSMRVDGYPYGGGAGMVMEAEPVFQAVQKAKSLAKEGTRVVYLTPAAEILTQTKAEEFAKEEELILLCGHYEGIDERVLEEVVTDNISIGDYVLTGGELGACVLMDAVSRFVPGVLHNEESSLFESMQDNLLEYPQYTRPEVWHGKAVPGLLRSGDHAVIEQWRHEQSLARTKERRPDLFEKSYRVNVLYFGSEENTAFALELAELVSRYAVLYDYNRRKLQKEKRRFGKKDVVIFVTDENNAGDAIFEKLSADSSKAVLVESSHTENTDGLTAFIKEKGFEILKSFTDAGCADALSLEIRKELLR